jgi:hypothetical protein
LINSTVADAVRKLGVSEETIEGILGAGREVQVPL